MLPGVGAEIMKVLMSSLWSAWSMAALQQPHSIIRELKIIVSFKKKSSLFSWRQKLSFSHMVAFSPTGPRSLEENKVFRQFLLQMQKLQ